MDTGTSGVTRHQSKRLEGISVILSGPVVGVAAGNLPWAA